MAVSVLTLKNLNERLEDGEKWKNFEKLISEASRSNIQYAYGSLYSIGLRKFDFQLYFIASIPIALQIGIAGLEDVLPEQKTESFEAIIGEYQGIAEARNTIRGWLEEFFEIK